MTNTTLTQSNLVTVARLAVMSLSTAERFAGQPWAVCLRGQALRTLESVGLTQTTATRLVENNA